MTPDLARRRSLLTAALGFALLETGCGQPAPPEVQTVRKWLDSWRGVSDVVTGMNWQGYMLNLPNVDTSTWRAAFSSVPMLMSSSPSRCFSRRDAGNVSVPRLRTLEPSWSLYRNSVYQDC